MKCKGFLKVHYEFYKPLRQRSSTTVQQILLKDRCVHQLLDKVKCYNYCYFVHSLAELQLAWFASLIMHVHINYHMARLSE